MPASRGLGGLRKRAGTKEPAAKKSSIPVVSAPADIDAAIADWNEADRELKTWKGKKEDAEARMTDECQDIRIARCKADGTLYPSIKVVGDHGHVQFTQAAKFLQMDADETEDRIKAICGGDFDNLFEIKTTYTLDETALAALPNADEIADKLVKALGKHVELLKAKSVVVPKEEYVRGRIGLGKPAIEKMASQLEADGLAVPCKASFRA
jgi:hypothetical protein